MRENNRRFNRCSNIPAIANCGQILSALAHISSASMQRLKAIRRIWDRMFHLYSLIISDCLARVDLDVPWHSSQFPSQVLADELSIEACERPSSAVRLHRAVADEASSHRSRYQIGLQDSRPLCVRADAARVRRVNILLSWRPRISRDTMWPRSRRWKLR
jgi:hypothetical protein